MFKGAAMRNLWVLALVSASACHGGAADLLSYADPAASTFVGAEWARLASTPHAAMLRGTLGELWAETRGLEFVEELERVLVSASTTPGGVTLLVVLQGRMNVETLRAMRSRPGVVAYVRQGAELMLSPDDGERPDLAVLTSNTVALGDRAALVALVERLGRGRRKDSPLLEQARRLAATADVWSIGSLDVFADGGLEKLLAKLKQRPDDLLAQSLHQAIVRARHGETFQFAFSADRPAAPPVAKKNVIRIFGLDTGPRELEFR